MNTIKDYDKLIKITIAGNSGTGKTTFLKMYCDNVFEQIQESTIGVEVRSKIIEHYNKKIKLQFWDTGGKKRYRNLISSYFKGSAIILLIFDLTNKKSFDRLTEWINIIKTRTNNINQKIILIGNKIDDYYHRIIPKEIIDEFLKKHEFFYYEISAKENIGISEIIKQIIELTSGDILLLPTVQQTDENLGCWSFLGLECWRFWEYVKMIFV